MEGLGHTDRGLLIAGHPCRHKPLAFLREANKVELDGTDLGGRQMVPLYSCSFRAPSAASRPPTDGRPWQTARALQLCTTPATFRFMHGLLLALTAKHEATRCLR